MEDMVWDMEDVDLEEWSLSELEIGNADLKVVDITTLLRMSVVYVVEPVEQVQQLLQTPPSVLQCNHNLNSEWVLHQ